MSCKVRLYFYDSNSEKEVACPQNCHLLINGENAEGETQQEATSLTFSYSTPLPGSGGYAFDKWAFSLSGVSFTPTSETTFTQDVTDVGYLEVRCCLAPQTCRIAYHFNNPGTTESTYQEALFADPYCKLIDAPSYLDSNNKIQVFVGWKTTESVEGAASITDEYAKDTAYAKYVKFWKNDVNGTKIYYQVMTAISATDNTDWDAMADRIVRLGANGDIYYSALSYYAPTALNVKMDAVWKSPTDSSLYPEGEIVYEDEDGNVIGRETAYSDTNVTAKGDDDFKGMAIDEWKTADGKTVKKGSTVKTNSNGGGSGWSMHFHVSMAVNKKCWVRYDARGGAVQPEPKQVEPGYEETIAALPSKKDIHGNPDPATCWIGGGSSYLPGEKCTINSDTTFTAEYKKGTKVTANFTTTGGNGTYTVTPKTKEFTVGVSTYEFPSITGSDGTIPTVQKWTTGKDGKVVTNATTVSNPNNHTVTAHLAPMKTVMLSPNGGSITVDGKTYTVPHAYKITVTPGVSTGELPAFSATREGYTDADYKGWFTSGAMDAKTLYDSQDKKNANTNTISVYVKWAQKVTFNANGGTYTEDPDAHGYFAGETYQHLPDGSNITRPDYEFAGWFTKANGGEQIAEGAKVPTTANRTLYAHWNPSVQTVTFRPHGGTISTTKLKYNISGENNKYSQFPTPTYVDSDGNPTFGFRGWYTSDIGGDLVQNGDTVTNESTRELHAQYNRQKKVSFYSGDGYFTGPDGTHYREETYFKVGVNYRDGAVDSEGKPIESYTFPQPSRDGGWSFKGWWTDKTSGTQVTENDTAVGTGNLLLYAHWENDKEAATITYDYNGGKGYVNDKLVWGGDRAGALPLPTKDEYSFTGWRKQSAALAASRRDGEVSGELVTSTTIIEGDISVKASWSKKIFLYYAIAPQG